MDDRLANELRAHAGALRALARQLVGEAAADDLVQDAALAALRSPPDRDGGLWGWLARVLRNRAHNERRDAARRARREAQQPPLEPPASASRVAEHHEAVQRLTAALLELPEPYHGTLLLRFFEGLAPSDIAAQTEVPLATVKSRLQRGLALLRERLDGGDRDRGGGPPWRAGLGAAFGLDELARAGSAAAVTAGATGAVLMGTAAKVGIVSAAAAAAVLAFAWGNAPRAPEPASASGGATTPVAAVGAPADAALPAAADAPRVAATAPPAAAVQRPDATVRGRCVDENGAPLAGVRVELTSNARNEETMAAWTKDHEAPQQAKLDAVSGADGVFTFAFWPPPPMQYFLSLQADGRAFVHGRVGDVLLPGALRDVGDVVLPPGALLHGRVVDRSGAPVADRGLCFTADGAGRAEIAATNHAQTATRADGSFATVHAVPSGVYRIRVEDARAEPKLVTVDGTLVVVVVDVVVDALPQPGPPLRGIVVDEADMPVRGAQVGVAGYMLRAGAPPENPVRTDEAGAFTLPQASGSPRAVTLAVRAGGFEPFTTPQPLAWGDANVRLVLRRAGAIALAVVRADDGRPVEDFQVRLAASPDNRTAHADRMRVAASGRHEQGRVRLEGVPRGAWWVVVEPKGDELALAAFVPVHVDGAAPVPVTVALQRTVACTVRVRTTAGVPVAGTVVELGQQASGAPTSDTYAQSIDGTLWAQRSTALRLDGGATGAAGEVVLRGPAATPLAVFVRGPGHVPFVAAAVRLDEPGPLELTVDAGTTLRGKVTPVEALADLRVLGNLPPTGEVDEQRRGLLPGLRLWRAEGRPHYFPDRPRPIADDGTFRLDGVPPGRWEVRITWSQSMGGPSRGMSLGKDATVATIDARGDPLELTLDAGSLRTGELEGVVVRDGNPVAGARVSLRLDGDTDNRSARDATADAAGRFRVRLRTGRWQLQHQAERAWLPAPERALVVAGQTTRHTFHVTSATLKLTVVDADGRPAQGVRVDLSLPDASPPYEVWLPRTDAAGVTTAVVPIGACVLSVLPEALQDPAAQQRAVENAGAGDPLAARRLELARITPQSGATVERELRLPAGYAR